VIIMHGLMKRVKLLVYKALERETEDPILWRGKGETVDEYMKVSIQYRIGTRQPN
jgi:hypothetical protein